MGLHPMLPPPVRLPPTPESPAEPTFMPHVREPLASLTSNPSSASLSDFATANNLSPFAAPAAAPSALLAGLNVLLHERDALASLHHLYATDPVAQASFAASVTAIATAVSRGGKLVISGVGKSGKIGQKLVATCNSLAVRASWLHATEAMHGDMGMIGPLDVVMLITFSATTPELLALLPHLPTSLPLLALTGRTDDCPLFANRPSDACNNVLLRAPIPVSEVAAFGVAAPTTSTTVAMALGDALALAVAQELHERPADVFRRCHPGGTIGATKR